MPCQHCGQEVEENMTRCPGCGNRWWISTASAPVYGHSVEPIGMTPPIAYIEHDEYEALQRLGRGSLRPYRTWTVGDQTYVQMRIIHLRQAGLSPLSICREVEDLVPTSVDIMDLVTRTLEGMEAARVVPPEPEVPQKSVWAWIRHPAV